jgi:predicted house-cleaning noncanonical NTP pyrophosphatase (MazG superfamily)
MASFNEINPIVGEIVVPVLEQELASDQTNPNQELASDQTNPNPAIQTKEEIQTKEYEGFTYHANFPQEWIENELPETGRDCPNCVGENHDGYAMWRGIILGYCGNCAMVYEGKRGAGFFCHGVELKGGTINYVTAYELYLGEIDLDKLGDLAANPEDTMESHEETKRVVDEDDEYDMDDYYADEYDEYIKTKNAEDADYAEYVELSKRMVAAHTEDQENLLEEEREKQELDEYLKMQDDYPCTEDDGEEYEFCDHRSCRNLIHDSGTIFCDYHRKFNSVKSRKYIK